MSACPSGEFPPLGRFLPNPKLRFMDQCREVMRFKRFSPRTVEAYATWIRRFIVWSGKRHPKEMGAREVNGFLAHLAVQEGVAASTQNQAFNAVVFACGKERPTFNAQLLTFSE